MHIVMVSAECAPAAEAGGPGDSVAGLARELSALGHQVEILLPRYDCLRFDRIRDLHKVHDLWVPLYDAWVHCDVEQGQADGLTCFFIDPHSPQHFFRRGRIHGETDDPERFVFFSRAAMEFLYKTGSRPDILHCHDWQTGLLPALRYELYDESGMGRTRVCYTVHDGSRQGRVTGDVLRLAGLDPETLMTPDRLQDPQTPTLANLMRGGVVYGDYVTTVSPRYAWELQYTDQGGGLQETLQARAGRFGGVLNGIDWEVWNPETDPYLAQTFCAETLQRKARDKSALRGQLMLEDASRPIVAVVARLNARTDLELIRHGIRFSLAKEAQFVLLGAVQDPANDAYIEDLRREFDHRSHCHLAFGYNEELAHRIFAGADLVLVPSRFEPCGQTPMIAMRYGAVPVVRRAGGMVDTVFDANYSDREFGERNGYVFDDYTEAGLESALRRAIGLWFAHPAYFRQLRINGMRQDHSWSDPAQRYLDIYHHVLG